MPIHSFFVPHGAPIFALRPGAAGAALAAAANALPQPRAIIIVSAHWDTAVPTVGFAEKLETIHDRIHEIRMRFEVLKRDAEIACLRAVLEATGHDRLIQTVRGSGYRFSSLPG